MLVLELDPVGTIAVVLAISAGASYGVTQVVKSLWRGWLKRHNQSEPWYYAAFLRGVACGAGTMMGLASLESLLGAGIGLAAGALNTFLVRETKKYLAARARGA